MATRLLLLRHGSSYHKEDKVVGPHGCRGLTPRGREEAQRLADRLKVELGGRPSAIYSSTLPRAVETAELLAATLEVGQVLKDCGLCTWHTPDFADGMLWAEYERDYGLKGGGGYRPYEAGNESWAELIARTGKTLEEIAAKHYGETVLIATHAETIGSSLTVFGELPLSLDFDLSITPTSITEWVTDGNPQAFPRPRWKLSRLNDDAHLRWNLQ